jgi:ADP-heptose:LPS heptosyltransferase
MLIHWHTEAPEHSLLHTFIEACLEERCRRPDASETALHSWSRPSGPISFTQYPGDTSGNAPSWQKLHAAAGPDLSVVVRPELVGGASLSLSSGDAYPTDRSAWWTWTAAAGTGVSEPWRDLPHDLVHPCLHSHSLRIPAGDPEVLGLVLDPLGLEAGEPWRDLARCLRKELPGLRVRFLFDPVGLRSRWDCLLGEAPQAEEACCPSLPRLDLADCGTVLLCGTGPEWTPLALQALGGGRHVIASRGAACAEYLEGGRGDLWGGRLDDRDDQEELLSRLRLAHQDPAERAARARRAAAWSRRWSPGREAWKLRSLVEKAAALAGPAPTTAVLHTPTPSHAPTLPRSPARWILRREVGIGDVVFTLSVAWALKQRDPRCEIALHTAARHAEWAQWFSFLEEVTSGPFEPVPGRRIGDFEQDFPQTSPLDRTLALGRVIGVQPREWVLAPSVPAALRAGMEALLGPARRKRIAFVPASRDHSDTRSLPEAVALRTASLLTELGDVVWLNQERRQGLSLPGVRDLTGCLTLPQAIAVLSLCDLCVSVDSGLLHLAVTLRKPVVGLFSHIGALQRLWLAERFVALQPSLPCAPCGEGPDAVHCRRSRWGSSGMLPCVALLQSERILEGAREALVNPGRQVWNLAPSGGRVIWDVDRLPPPWVSEF